VEELMGTKMSVVEREIGVLYVHGNLVGIEETKMFQEAVKGLLDQHYRKVILDFGDVRFVNSTGLGELISAHTSSVRRGCRIVLCNVNNSVSSLLVITGLDKILEVKKTKAEARESLA
jgi:anti-sigma B factor antagonist